MDRSIPRIARFFRYRRVKADPLQLHFNFHRTRRILSELPLGASPTDILSALRNPCKRKPAGKGTVA